VRLQLDLPIDPDEPDPGCVAHRSDADGRAPFDNLPDFASRGESALRFESLETPPQLLRD
jgi:hypothetical protein